MPKLGSDEESAFSVAAVKVDSQTRVRLPAEIEACISWLPQDAQAVDCFGIPGVPGSLQIIPINGDLASRRKRLIELARKAPPKGSESRSPLVRLARLYAATWPLRLHIHSGHRRFTIPDGAVKTGVLDVQADGQVIVFAMGDVLELWGMKAWQDQLAVISGDETAIMDQLEIDDRSADE